MATKKEPRAATTRKARTVAEMLEEILGRLDAIEQRIASQPPTSGGSTAAPTPGMQDRVGPGLVTIGGVAINLREPIAADWEPSAEAITFGSQTGRAVDEPSNGWRVGRPMRSAAGYPLHYPIGRDANGNDIAAGQATIQFAGRTHESDSAVAQFKAQRGTRDDNLDREADRQAGESYDGPFGVWDLTLADKVYLADVRGRYKQATGKDVMRDGIIAGRNEHLDAAIHEGNYHKDRGEVDLSTYDSPLKEAVEQRMAGA